MVLNFKEFKIYSGISHENCFAIDIREQFANIMYGNVAGIAALELARKIYRSESDTEYDDNEIAIIQRVKSICTPQLIEALDTVLELQR